MVQAKTMGWFDYRSMCAILVEHSFFHTHSALAVTKWIRRNALDRLAEKFEGPGSGESDRTADSVVWEDRKGAKTTINNYLTDYPSEYRLFYPKINRNLTTVSFSYDYLRSRSRR